MLRIGLNMILYALFLFPTCFLSISALSYTLFEAILRLLCEFRALFHAPGEDAIEELLQDELAMREMLA